MGALTGKTAIVTGASKGIGAGIAKSFAAEGAKVVVNYASDRDGAERVVADIRAAGGEAAAVKADMSKEAEVSALFDAAEAAFGPLDVLVNNAGVYQFAPIEEFTEALYRRQFDVNVLGPLLAIREAVKRFRPGGGNVINVSSVVSESVYPTSTVYSATKAALDSITRNLAAELGPRGVRVNAINPGATETEGFGSTGIKGSEAEEQIVAATPLGRLGRPDDIARAAVFLASDASGWITGEAVRVSGGQR
ncbi:MAG: oxidoreductase [Ancylobacter novellus]|uniref:Oxidoreductase n=1 Tax=Ancylobacter novellus TaxID=921 RepID=A0A2W5MU04_ANCNO|nr:MAG: oxidoreductase [Ancylobacter novellus]